MDQEQLLTREEVAALLRVHVRTLRRMALEGVIPPPIRIGERVIRWRRETLTTWLNAKDIPS